MNDIQSQLDAIETEGTVSSTVPSADGSVRVKRKYTKRAKPTDPTEKTFEITTDAVSGVRKGLLIVLESVTKLPLSKTDENLCQQWDVAACYITNQYVGEDYKKYVPFAQLGIISALIVLDAYEKKSKQDKIENRDKVEQT